MKFCPFCGSQMSVAAQFCPSCGKKNPSPVVAQSNGSAKMFAAVSVLLLIIFSGLIYMRQGQRKVKTPSIEKPALATQTSATPVPQPTMTPAQAEVPAQSQTIRDNSGALIWNFYCTSSALHCTRTRNGTDGHIDFDGTVYEGKTVANFVPLVSGATLHCIFQNVDGIFLSESLDTGEKWEPHVLIAPGIRLLGATVSLERDSSKIIRVVGEATQADTQAGINTGDKVRIILQRYQGPGQWKVMEKKRG